MAPAEGADEPAPPTDAEVLLLLRLLLVADVDVDGFVNAVACTIIFLAFC